MAFDESYTAPSGLMCSMKKTRPPITPDSLINFCFVFENGHTHANITVEPNPESLPPKPLSAEHHDALKHFIEYLRVETSKKINRNKTESIQDGLLYITQAIGVRLNQHWQATEAGKELSLEELLSVLTMEDEVKAEEQMRLLMESLTVRDDAPMVDDRDQGSGEKGEGDPLQVFKKEED